MPALRMAWVGMCLCPQLHMQRPPPTTAAAQKRAQMRALTHTRDILRLCQAAEWSAAEKPLRELRVLEVLGVRCGAVRGSSRVCLRRPDRMQQEEEQPSCWQSGRGAAHTHTYTHTWPVPVCPAQSE
jgi:hypothetical protein